MSDGDAARREAQSEANGLLIQVDHDLCAGFADCAERAPDVFALNEDRLAVILDAEAADRDELIEAAEACPVSAILLFDEAGAQVAPGL